MIISQAGAAGAVDEAPANNNVVTEQAVVKSSSYKGKQPKVRLKDISHFSDVRDNQLVGYGLVVGLSGTGDTLSSAPYTKESLTGMLERLGVNIRDGKIPSGKNVAAVMVTATLPAFAKRGGRIDVKISALGDAKDLNGGTLLVTPLLGADGEVYAVAQGALSVSGFKVQGRAASQSKGVPTSGKISNGAIVEKEVGFQLVHLKTLNIVLNNPDFTTAQRVSNAINIAYKKVIATATDSGTVVVAVPNDQSKRIISFMTELEQIFVEPDLAAKVVIDDHNGVITITSNVRISPIALTHGSLTVKVVESPKVFFPPESDKSDINVVSNVVNTGDNNKKSSDYIEAIVKQQRQQNSNLEQEQEQELKVFKNLYPNYNQTGSTQNILYNQLINQQSLRTQSLKAEQQKQIDNFVDNKSLKPIQKDEKDDSTSVAKAMGGGVIADNTIINVKEEKGKFTLLDSGVSLEELVNALNALGTSPNDMAAILQNIKAAGALQAEIVMI